MPDSPRPLAPISHPTKPSPVLFDEPITVGWCEWVRLTGSAAPDGLPGGAAQDTAHVLPPLRVKIDTGARTSSLHAEEIEAVERGGVRMVRFALDLPHNPKEGVPVRRYIVEAPLVGERHVRSSNGVIQTRLTARLTLRLGGRSWEADVTLAHRTSLRFPMLLGRSAMQSAYILVDPRARFALGKIAPTP